MPSVRHWCLPDIRIGPSARAINPYDDVASIAVGLLRRFGRWARRLDESMLGPGGWTPKGVSYAQYRFGFWNLARQVCPLWLRLVPPAALALFLYATTLSDGHGWPIMIFCLASIFVASARTDRAIRLAARAGTLPGTWGADKASPRTSDDA